MNSLSDDDIFVIDKKNALGDMTIDQFIAKLKSIMHGKVAELYLFGSYAKGTAHSDSDIDIIIVCDTDWEFHKRVLLFPEVFDLSFDIEMRIYTIKEFEKIKSNAKNNAFWKEVLETATKII
ncbi:MAG: nucleotidyltransferase domain-containing protein [Oligoflexia bacterium]|nr:nucleotidyltransferase domain-containing protein [Oligoflexia bacterium]